MLNNKSILLLVLILVLGGGLRFYNLKLDQMFIGDQVWFYDSARRALALGQLPLVGIPSSITWLHQGAIWTYLLIPILFFSNFNPSTPAYFTAFLSVVSGFLVYYAGSVLIGKKTGLIATAIFTLSYFMVIHSRFAYHTTLFPLFLLISILSIMRKRNFIAGLFIAFLYQLHLLSFIYWPVFLFLTLRSKSSLTPLLLGFLVGVIPFILYGPGQLFGIFVWGVYRVVRGVSGVSLFSESYYVVISLAIIFVISKVVASVSSRLIFPLLLIYALGNSWYLLTTNYLLHPYVYGLSLGQKKQLVEKLWVYASTESPNLIVTGPGEKFDTYKLPYSYLIWYQSKNHKPNGSHSVFSIDEPSQSFRVIK